MRANYWGDSKFSKWIQDKFGDYENPPYAEMSEWNDINNYHKLKSPFVYWLTEVVFDKVQNMVNWPSDRLNDIRYYCKNRFSGQTHLIDTHLSKGDYHECEEMMLHGLFNILVDFIEIEKASMMRFDESTKDKYPEFHIPWYLKWKVIRSPVAGLDHIFWEISLKDSVDENDPNEETKTSIHNSQSESAQEQLDLYNWWKIIRPNRPEPIEASGLRKHYEENRKSTGHAFLKTETKEQKKENDLMHKKYHQMQLDYKTEDEKMMIRLIKIRESLWT